MNDAQLTALWTRDHAHGAARRARDLPHRRPTDLPARPRRRRSCCALEVSRRRNSLDLRRATARRSMAASISICRRLTADEQPPEHAGLMDGSIAISGISTISPANTTCSGATGLIDGLDPGAGNRARDRLRHRAQPDRGGAALARRAFRDRHFGSDAGTARRGREGGADALGSRWHRRMPRASMRARCSASSISTASSSLRAVDDPRLAGAIREPRTRRSATAARCTSSISASRSACPAGSAALFAWLAKFHVSPRDSLREVLELECRRVGASLRFDLAFRGYDVHAVMTKP